jgi:hypothetical protein
LRNPDTNAGFYVVQQAVSSSQTPIEFSANLNTSEGVITVENIALNGRQSKILVTDYRFGSSTLLYSSVDILTYGTFNKDVIIFYLEEGQVGQFALKTSPSLANHTSYGTSTVAAAFSGSIATITYTQGPGKTVLELNGVLVYLLERNTAWKFWAPSTTSNPDVKPNEQIFVFGPYLVRSAYISHNAVYVSGDNDNVTTIEVYTGNPAVQTIDWNGIRLKTTKTPYGSITATIPGTENRRISLPALTGWRSANSLPEKEPLYDDSKWTACNKTSTLSPIAPLTLPVLFSSDYGYYTGAKIYRGYFDGTGATALNITCSGGLAFGWNAWLNGIYLGGHNGNASLTTTNAVLNIPLSVLKSEDNLVTVLVDYNGHDETSTAKGVENPRGILGASLIPAVTTTATDTGFKLWKIQGNAGGASNLDPVRGPMNEGGLYGERLGWHLPYFNPSTSGFSHSSPITGLNASGVEFYITTFNLNIDSDLDVPLGISLTAPSGTIARVMIWINGYQYGKFVPHIGPQTRFPIPPGVINNRGSNTLALSLWAMTDAGAKLDNIELFSYGAYQTDFDFNNNWEYLQPRWDKTRLKYA